MAELGQLERAKRRRLQEAYGDLRPAQGGPDRQAKLRDLLTGAMADAGASGALGSGSGGGGPDSAEATQALAAAAAANLAAVVSSDKRKPPVTGRRAAATAVAAAAGSPGLTAAGGWAAPAGLGSPVAAWGSPVGAAGAGRGRTAAGGATPVGGGGHCAGGGNPQRAPPPDPMAGGFIPDTDPITRLSRLPTAVAVLQQSGTPGAGTPGSSMGAGRGGTGGALRIAAGLASRLAAGGGAAGARPGGGGGTAAVLAAAAEAAAAARASAEEDAMLAEAEMPSDIELALMSLRADFRAHAACAALPPLALRSQLAAAGLRDGGSVERQLDEQRQAGRVRLFRLPTGRDEFGILLTSDYRDCVRRAADEAATAAAATATAGGARPGAGAGASAGARTLGSVNGGGGSAGIGTPVSLGTAPARGGGRGSSSQQAPNAADTAARMLSYGAYGSEPAEDYGQHTSAHQAPYAYGDGSGGGGGGAGGGGGGGGGAGRAITATAAGSGILRRDSKWHMAAEAFLARVVDRYFDFELSSDHLLRLLLSGPGPGARAGTQSAGQARAGGGSPGTPAEMQAVAAGAGAAAAAAAAAAGPSTAAEAEEVVSLLLQLGCLGRHTDGDADAYVLAVPGAGKVVKSVADGRRELLLWLSKRQHQEAPEKTICETRLQRSCLPALYHIRDLVGRGSARRIAAAVGPMIKLTPLGVAAATAAALAGKKPAAGARRRQHS